MMKQALSLFLLMSYLLVVISPAFSYGTIGFPKTITSPEMLVNWFQSEFAYEFKFPDYRQTPEETVRLRKGDCEDFALLSKAILESIGIKSDVLIIKYRAINILHAVCVFKRGSVYSFISNREMVETRGRTVIEAMSEIFPDWDSLTYLSAGGEFSRTIDRGYRGSTVAHNLTVPSIFSALLGPEHRDISVIEYFLSSQLKMFERPGIESNVGTFTTILGDYRRAHVRFMFNKMELTIAGFRVPVEAIDKDGVRTYYVIFSFREIYEGFSVSVYSEKDWKRARQFNTIIPHSITGIPSYAG